MTPTPEPQTLRLTPAPRPLDPQAHETPDPSDLLTLRLTRLTDPDPGTSDPQDSLTPILDPQTPAPRPQADPGISVNIYRIPNFHANYLDRGCPPAQKKQASAHPSDPARQTYPVPQDLPLSPTLPLPWPDQKKRQGQNLSDLSLRLRNRFKTPPTHLTPTHLTPTHLTPNPPDPQPT